MLYSVALAILLGALSFVMPSPVTASDMVVGKTVSGEVKISGSRVIPLPPGSWTVRASFDTDTPLRASIPGPYSGPNSQKLRNLVLASTDRDAPVAIFTVQWTEFARVNWSGQPCNSGANASRPFKDTLNTSENSPRVKCVAGMPLEGLGQRIVQNGSSGDAVVRRTSESLSDISAQLPVNSFAVFGYLSRPNDDRISWHLYFNLDRLGLNGPDDLKLSDPSKPSAVFMNQTANELMDWSRRYLEVVETGFWPSLFSSQRATVPALAQTRRFARIEPTTVTATANLPSLAMSQNRPARKGLRATGTKPDGSSIDLSIIDDEGPWLTFMIDGHLRAFLYRGVAPLSSRDSEFSKSYIQAVDRLQPLESGKVERFTQSRDNQTWQYTITVRDRTRIATPLGEREVVVVEIDHRGIVNNRFHEIETIHVDSELEIPWRRAVSRLGGTPSNRIPFSLTALTGGDASALLRQPTPTHPPAARTETQPVPPAPMASATPQTTPPQSPPSAGAAPPPPSVSGPSAQSPLGPSSPTPLTDIATPERRVALVIGNSAYRMSPLRNPANDADDMASALRALGFDVMLARDASLREMRSMFRRFADQVEKSDVALVFFAGHGIELNGRNYLIPTDADIQREYEIADQAFDSTLIVGMLEETGGRNRKRVNIVILDACRNNDLPRSMRNARAGLARIDAPVGTFIAFSTAPGRVALDGDGRNSPFTKNLLTAIREPGQSIEQVFKNVRRSVVDQTSGEQIPWESSSLIGDFFFSGKAR
jgi:hypothetical protein